MSKQSYQGEGLDEAVNAIIGAGDRKQRARRMTEAQRRQAERDAQRQRVTYEVDPRVADFIARVAEHEGCSPASVVNRLMMDALARYTAGDVEFYGHRRPSQGPRYDWVVELDEEAVETLEEALARAFEAHD
jgi:hypothetical protein